MKKVLILALLVFGLVLAGTVSAHMMRSGAMKGARLWSGPHVRASVVYRIGDTVRIYNPTGNDSFCKGDRVPIFRSIMSNSKIASSSDLSGKQLVGEVRIFNIVGEKYAYGRLIVGSAREGDMAAKPGMACLARERPSRG